MSKKRPNIAGYPIRFKFITLQSKHSLQTKNHISSAFVLACETSDVTSLPKMPEKWLQFIRNSSWCGGKAAKIELELRKNPLKGCRTSGI